ncbi:MAG: peptide-methionine (R)-S-oxide reductase MsrB [Rhodospirillales bacterium]
MTSRRTLLWAAAAGLGATAIGALTRGRAGAAPAPAQSFEVTHSDAEWQTLLTPQQYQVLRRHDTERAGSSPLDKLFADGTYLCAGCALPVFPSSTKFDSGTGWPSFWAPIEGNIGTTEDRSWLMTRTEVHCRRCGGHLGHVFPDGPPPTGLRYCMNGVALKFVPA